MITEKTCLGKSFLVILLLLLWPASLMAADYVGVTAVIDKKIKHNLGMIVAEDEEGSSEEIYLTSDKGDFIIDANTKIVNKRGETISINRLAVPCEARIMYQPQEKRNSKAKQIKILRTLPKAQSTWPKPMPE